MTYRNNNNIVHTFQHPYLNVVPRSFNIVFNEEISECCSTYQVHDVEVAH